jgi:hypothetical protein
MEKTEAARAHLAEPTERVIDAVIDGRRCAIGRAKARDRLFLRNWVRTGIPTGWSDDRETRGDRESLFGIIL